MSLSKEFKRYSTGLLYTDRELRKAEENLRAEGFTDVSDNRTPGARLYKKPGSEDCAIAYLDTLGGGGLSSGIMFILRVGQEVEATTVWKYAKKKNPAKPGNILTRALKKTFR